MNGNDFKCESSSASRCTQRLQPNTIGPWGLAALAIGITSPAMGLFALWGPMQSLTGPITPLIFLASMMLTLPTAVSYASLNSHAPSAGAASTWLWKCIGPGIGYQAGLLMTTYFLMAAIAQPLIFSLFFRDLLQWLMISPPLLPTLIIGVLVGTVPAAWACLRGTEASIRTMIGLMVIETFVVVALSATILFAKFSGPEGITFSAFDPHQATRGLTGFWSAMILGVLAFCGFDVVSSAAEEAKAPREHVPQAILLTVVGIAIFWAINAWMLTSSTLPQVVEQYTSQGLTAVTPVAQAYWGLGSLIVIATAFTGLTAVYISCVQGCSRVVFALARHGLLPAPLAQLSGPRSIPRNSVLFILTAVVLLDVLTILVMRNGLDGFTWWANAVVFFAALTFFAVNLANFLYFFRLVPQEFRWFKNGIVPLIGAALNLYLIYAAFFSALWSTSLRTGKSVVLACLILLSIQACTVILLRYFRPDLFRGEAPLTVTLA